MRRALLLLTLPLLAATPEAEWPDLAKAPSGVTEDLGTDLALVISVGDYERLPDVSGAVENGAAWTAYLRARGASVEQVSNGDATREGILAAAKRVHDRWRSGGSVWLVFIGHGAPGNGEGALVGADAGPTAASLEQRSVSQLELLDALGASAGVPIFAVVDVGFSGTSAAGALTPEALQPVRALHVSAAETTTLLMAAQADQYAGSLPGLGRPAFSWLVLGALRGWGDRNGDGTVTAQEALDYSADWLAERVTGRTQQPQGAGNLDRPLSREREREPDLSGLVARTAGEAEEAKPAAPPGVSTADSLAAQAAQFMALELSGPGPGKFPQKEEDQALRRQLTGEMSALIGLERAAQAVIDRGEPRAGAEAHAVLARAYAELADDLLRSYVPSYLTEVQREIYATALADKASVLREKSRSAWQALLKNVLGTDLDRGALADEARAAIGTPPRSPGGNPRVYVQGGISTSGMDKSLIEAVITRNLTQVASCYERELTKNPRLGGKITVRFVMAKDGSVSSATTMSSTMGSPPVETCVNGRFIKFQFPALKGGGPVIVSCPLLFAPG